MQCGGGRVGGSANTAGCLLAAGKRKRGREWGRKRRGVGLGARCVVPWSPRGSGAAAVLVYQQREREREGEGEGGGGEGESVCARELVSLVGVGVTHLYIALLPRAHMR